MAKQKPVRGRLKNPLPPLSINEQVGDIPTHYMKSGSSMRPKAQLKELKSFRERVLPKSHRGLDLEYDLWFNTNEIMTIRSWLYTDFMGNGIVFKVNSVKINDKLFKSIVDSDIKIDEERLDKIINNFRDKYSNKFEIFQAANEAKIDIGTLSALIQAGSLEGFKQSRSKVVLEAQLWHLLKVREKKQVFKFAEEYEYDLIKIIKYLTTREDEKGKSIIKDSRYGTIKKHYKPYLDIYTLNSKSERFANWYYEKTLLGYTHNVSLKDIFQDKRPDLCTVRDALEADVGTNLVFAAWVDDCWTGVSKAKGTKYYKSVVSDETGILNVMIFSKKMESCESMNNGLPDKKNIIIVKGRKFEDVVFADVIGVQDHKVYTKLSELKKING